MRCFHCDIKLQVTKPMYVTINKITYFACRICFGIYREDSPIKQQPIQGGTRGTATLIYYINKNIL